MIERWLERWFGGHMRVGRVTIYGRNAMHWGVTVWTKRWGYVCFRLPLRCFGRWWPLYLYVSPNATPWAATWAWRDSDGYRSHLPAIRRAAFGHNFDTDEHLAALGRINGWAEEPQP